MIEAEDINLYKKCMLLIKYRFKYIDSVLTESHVLPSIMSKYEFLYLQYRFIFETIAISTICSNRMEYKKIRSTFQKDWNPNKIFSTVASVNPNFYPVPMETKLLANNKVHYDPIKSGFMTLEEMKKAIGICGDNLHAQNLYKDPHLCKEDIDVRNNFINWNKQLKVLLGQHFVYIKRGVYLHTIMRTTDTNDVSVREFHCLGAANEES